MGLGGSLVFFVCGVCEHVGRDYFVPWYLHEGFRARSSVEEYS